MPVRYPESGFIPRALLPGAALSRLKGRYGQWVSRTIKTEMKEAEKLRPSMTALWILCDEKEEKDDIQMRGLTGIWHVFKTSSSPPSAGMKQSAPLTIAATTSSLNQHRCTQRVTRIQISTLFYSTYNLNSLGKVIPHTLTATMIIAFKYGKRKYKEHQAKKEQDQVQNGSRPSDAGMASTSTESSRPFNGERNTTSSKPDERQLTPEEKAEKKRKRIYRWKVVLGLSTPFLLQALDTTIVASALPTIAEKFSKTYYNPTPSLLG